jgi:arylsulfatase A-like enzyme
LADRLPELPLNFHFDKNEPAALSQTRQARDPFQGNWSRRQWRYYLWSYYRHIEFVDAEIGRILQAVEDSGYSKDTLIVLTADHGEGLAHHQMVRKNTLYDEAARVPLLFSWPGHIPENTTNTTHLASGLDIVPTLCDYAGIKTPKSMRGVSLRPILEGRSVPGHEFVITEVNANKARMVRTQRYKYVTYKDDSVEQLFDMKHDPGETRNLATNSRHASVLAEHRKLLRSWERRLDVAANVPNTDAWWYKG